MIDILVYFYLIEDLIFFFTARASILQAKTFLNSNSTLHRLLQLIYFLIIFNLVLLFKLTILFVNLSINWGNVGRKMGLDLQGLFMDFLLFCILCFEHQ